jgi:DNA-binding PadR family transcriptional regulator
MKRMTILEPKEANAGISDYEAYKQAFETALRELIADKLIFQTILDRKERGIKKNYRISCAGVDILEHYYKNEADILTRGETF